MTGRDLRWRLGGAMLATAGVVISLLDGAGAAGDPAIPVAVTGPLSFVVALLGLVLLVQGKRVAASWRVERGRHRELPLAIHHRRGRQRVLARRR